MTERLITDRGQGGRKRDFRHAGGVEASRADGLQAFFEKDSVQHPAIFENSLRKVD